MSCRGRFVRLWHRVGRQKLVGQSDTHTGLHRCLSTLQLTAIGIGATIGVGIYVLLGVAIRDYAGPGVILSFLFAGLIVLTNAVIYAEYGSRIPHTGAAYTYIYSVVGELAAFVTGWMYLLAGACSGATGARAWSGFVDSLFNNSIQSFLDERVGQLDIGPPFARSLDWLGFVFYLVMILLVSFNVNCSSIINTVLAVLTTGILIFVTFAGVIIGDVKRIGDTENGGFLPFGFQGVIVGASAAFYAFNGFDNICIAAEEAKDPSKSVPRAILIELAIVTVVYCGSAVGTLSLIPYSEIDLRAPIPSAFAYQGVTWAKVLVTIGPAIAITNLNLLSLFSLSRTAYRMAKDGLLFAKFAYIHPRTKTPIFGVVVFGLLMAVATLLLDLKDLVRFAVLCMLFQYVLLAPAVISLRTSGRFDEVPLPATTNLFTDIEIDVQPSSQDTDAENRGQPQTEVTDGNGAAAAGNGGEGRSPSDLLKDPLKSSFPYVEACDLGRGASPQDDGSPETSRDVAPLIDITADHRTDTVTQNSYSVDNSCNGDSSNTTTNVDDGNEQHVTPSPLPQPTNGFRGTKTRQQSEEPTKGGQGVVKEFFKILTTTRTVLLLVFCLGGLAAQIGLGWENLSKASGWAVLSTSLLTALVVFFCEVLRRRCSFGDYDGFKVPFVPYVPALSCFLNMLLLVSAADVMGLVEFAVLVTLGLIVYVIMVMTERTQSDDVRPEDASASDESYALLSREGDDDSFDST